MATKNKAANKINNVTDQCTKLLVLEKSNITGKWYKENNPLKKITATKGFVSKFKTFLITGVLNNFLHHSTGNPLIIKIGIIK